MSLDEFRRNNFCMKLVNSLLLFLGVSGFQSGFAHAMADGAPEDEQDLSQFVEEVDFNEIERIEVCDHHKIALSAIPIPGNSRKILSVAKDLKTKSFPGRRTGQFWYRLQGALAEHLCRCQAHRTGVGAQCLCSGSAANVASRSSKYNRPVRRLHEETTRLSGDGVRGRWQSVQCAALSAKAQVHGGTRNELGQTDGGGE